ncbi:MAG: hypothetical protein LC104_04410 [Bacteroidales bacterium]|nr:hypothetical protein [Bacteroidales bacterium]
MIPIALFAYLAAINSRIAVCAPIPAETMTILITLELSTSQVVAGKNVTLTESLMIPKPIEVKEVVHRVYRIGKYSDRTGQFEQIDLSIAHDTLITLDSGVPWFVVFGKPSPPKKLENGAMGFAFPFQPEKPGIYIIYSDWKLGHGRDVLRCVPVILTVKPAKQ